MKTSNGSVSGIIEKAIDVIVVEDDHDCRTLIATILSAHLCLVRAVDSAHAARIAAIDGIPDVVVTDLHLGIGAPGWALAQALRDEPRTTHVGLIAITGRVEPWSKVVGPFDAYLRKPVEVALLVALVKQLADVSRATRRAARTAAVASPCGSLAVQGQTTCGNAGPGLASR